MNKSKMLHIVRHAKSSWDYENVSDFDRPLKPKGIVNAYEMARRMKIRNSLPLMIITSPANRAFHTALIFARVIELSFEQFRVDPDLYGADVDTLYHKIKNFDDKFHSIMIFGHNPEFTNLANFLGKDPIDEVPTCGMVSILFDTDKWKEVGKNSVTQVDFDYPKKEMQI
jgi:phosphohistidine phosphatase